MSKEKPVIKIPLGIKRTYRGNDLFSETLEVMHYPEPYFTWKGGTSIKHDPEWIDNLKFFATVKVLNTQRGRSAAYFQARIETILREDKKLEGCYVPIFISSMLDMLQRANIYHGGTITGLFTFEKRGQNYGLCLAKESK